MNKENQIKEKTEEELMQYLATTYLKIWECQRTCKSKKMMEKMDNLEKILDNGIKERKSIQEIANKIRKVKEMQ